MPTRLPTTVQPIANSPTDSVLCFHSSFPTPSKYPPSNRDLFVRGAHLANARIVFGAQGEAAAEDRDRVWRRWSAFCRFTLGGVDTSLVGVSPREENLIIKVFLEVYRGSRFDPELGKIIGQRPVPMAGQTVSKAASALAASFRDSLGRSPLHPLVRDDRSVPIGARTGLKPDLKNLLSAMKSSSPNKN